MLKNKNNSNSKKPKSKARKIISWIITGIAGLLLVFVIGIQVMGLTTKGDNFGVPSYFGKQVLIVLTDSMEPEYPVNSAVFVDKIPMEEYQIGDDITFLDKNGTGYVMTHRISDIMTPEESGDGLYHFETHGINKDSNQCVGDCTGQKQYFTQNEVLGKVTGCSMFVGMSLSFLTSPWGLLIILLIPTLYLIISSVIDIFRAVKDPVDHDKDDDNNKDQGNNDKLNLSEEDKKRLKQELLEEMLNNKGKVKS